MRSTRRKSETYEERNIIAHHQLDLVRQAGALGEVDQVLKGEGEADMLVHLNEDVGRVVLLVGVAGAAFAF